MSTQGQIWLQWMCWQHTVPIRYINIEFNAGYFQWCMPIIILISRTLSDNSFPWCELYSRSTGATFSDDYFPSELSWPTHRSEHLPPSWELRFPGVVIFIVRNFAGIGARATPEKNIGPRKLRRKLPFRKKEKKRSTMAWRLLLDPAHPFSRAKFLMKESPWMSSLL